MYVTIRRDGAIGIGRGTEGLREIAIGYGEAHMIAAALEKLGQTARSYKQTYKKTTDVGAGNKIDFERSADGVITLIGDGHSYFCTEEEIRNLSKMLMNLPPIEISPASAFVDKITPRGTICLVIKNGGQTLELSLPEAALVRTAIQASIKGKYYEEHITVGNKTISVMRTSDLKWELGSDNTKVKFTAYEIESLIAGVSNGILEVLMDLVKSLGSDDISDIRIKSHLQRMEQDTAKVVADHNKAKAIVREISSSSKKILGGKIDADLRTHEFVKMCLFVYSKLNPAFAEPLFDLFSKVYVAKP